MKGLKELDRVLRGEAARPDRRGPPVALLPLLAANLLLAAFYGVCMGIFGLSGRPEPESRQMPADALKVPLLSLLTLAVTFPSLYVFSALVGSRLGVGDLARLLAAGLGVLLAVLAAFGPIVVLLNVAVFTLAAGFGLSYLVRTIDHLLPRPAALRPTPQPEPGTGTAPAGESGPAGAPPPSPAAVRTVLYVWLAVFALVGGSDELGAPAVHRVAVAGGVVLRGRRPVPTGPVRGGDPAMPGLLDPLDRVLRGASGQFWPGVVAV